MSNYQSITTMAASLSITQSECVCSSREEAVDAVTEFSAMLAGRIASTASMERILPQAGLVSRNGGSLFDPAEMSALREQVEAFKSSLLDSVNAAFDAFGVDSGSEPATVTVSPDGTVNVDETDTRSITLNMVMVEYVEVRQKITWIADTERAMNPEMAGKDIAMRFSAQSIETFFVEQGAKAEVASTSNADVASTKADQRRMRAEAMDERRTMHRRMQEESDERVRAEKEAVNEARNERAEEAHRGASWT